MLKNKKKLRRLERNTPGYAARTAQTLVLAGALVLGGAAMAGAATQELGSGTWTVTGAVNTLNSASTTTTANSDLTVTGTGSSGVTAIIKGVTSIDSFGFTSTGAVTITSNTDSAATLQLGVDSNDKTLATIKTINVQGLDGDIATLQVKEANSGLLIAGTGTATAGGIALGDGGTLNLMGYTALKLDTADAAIDFDVKGTDGALVNVTGLSNTIGQITSTASNAYGLINVGTVAAGAETSGVLIVTGNSSVIGNGVANNGGVTMKITDGSAAYFSDVSGTAPSLGVGGTIIAKSATIGVGNGVTDFAANKGLLVGKSLTLAGGDLVVADGLTVDNASAGNAVLVQNSANSNVYGDVILKKGTLTLTGNTMTVYTADSYGAEPADKKLGNLSINADTDVAGGSGSLAVGTLKLDGRTTLAASGTGLDITASKLDLSGPTTIGAIDKGVHKVTINGTNAGATFLNQDLTLVGAASNEATLTLKGNGGSTEKNITLSGNGADGDTKLIVESGTYTVGNIAVGSTAAAKFGDIQVGNANNGGNLTATKIELYGGATGNATLTVGEKTQTAKSLTSVGTLTVGDGTKVGEVVVQGNSGTNQGSTLTIGTVLTVGAGSSLTVDQYGTVDASALTNMGSQAGEININGTGAVLKTGNLSIANGKLNATAADGNINLAAGTLYVDGKLTLTGGDVASTAYTGNVVANELALDAGTNTFTQSNGSLTLLGVAEETSFVTAKSLTASNSTSINLGSADYTTNGGTGGTFIADGGTLDVKAGKWSVTEVDVKNTANSTLVVNDGVLKVDTLKTAGTTGTVTVNGTGTLQAKLSNFGVIKDDKTIDRAGNGATVNSSTKVGGNGRLQLDGTSGYAGDLTLDQAVAIRGGVISSTASLKLTEYNINATVADKLTKANGLELPTATLGLENSQSLTANTIVKNLGVHSSATDAAIGVTVGPNATFTMIGDGANNKLITGTLKDNQVVTFTLDPAGGLTLGDATGTTRTGGILNANVAGSGTLAAYNGDFTLAGTVSNTTDIEGKGTNIVSEKDLSIAGVNLETGTLRTASDKDLTVSGAVTLKGDGSGIASGKDLTLGSAFTTQEDGGASVLSAAGKLTALDINSWTNEDTSSVAIQATTLDAGNVVLGKGSTLVTTGTGYGTDGTGSTVNSLMMKRATGSVGDLKVTTVTSIYNGSSLDVKGTLTATQGIFVGADTDVDGSTLTVNKLDLNNATLFVDPTWVDGVYNPSQVAVKSFVGDKINGEIGVGRNSQVTLGSNDPAWLDAQVQKLGNWNKDGITAALGVYAPQTLATGQGIVVDGTKTMTTPPAFAANTVNFADNSLLVVNAAGLGDKAALTAETKGAIVIADKAKLRITGVQSGKTVKVLDNFDVTTGITADKGWSEKNGNLSTDSRMMYGTLRIDDANDAINVDIHARAAQFVFPKLSGPMAGLVDGFYAQGLYDVDSPAAGIRFMSRATSETHMYSAEAAAATIEGAAQMGAVAGVQISTMGAANAASGAALTRTSFAQPLMDMTKAVAVNQDVDGNLSLDTGLSAGDGMKNGLGVWIMPLYQSNRTWGQKAENFKTGMSSDLGGIALGADYTINDMFRFGAAFNVGGGYAQSSGDFNKTDNNFNFWGVNLYGGWTMNNFGLSADVGYTSNYNKVEQDMPVSMAMGNLKSDITSSAWSAGLKGEYKFETSVVDIIPHIGVRYMGLTTDSYDVKSGGTVFAVEQDFQSIWTFPIGVAFNKTISTDSGWMFKPQVDLSVIPAAGDVKAKSKASIPGVMGDAEMKMQVVDYVTFDGGLGLEMGKDNLSFGINYNIQASEHRTGHGVFGTLRYEF